MGLRRSIVVQVVCRRNSEQPALSEMAVGLQLQWSEGDQRSSVACELCTARTARTRCVLYGSMTNVLNKTTHRCSEAAASFSSFSSPIMVCAVLFLITVVSACMVVRGCGAAKGGWGGGVVAAS